MGSNDGNFSMAFEWVASIFIARSLGYVNNYFDCEQCHGSDSQY